MALAEDLLTWAATRPWWQQQILARHAEGGTFTAADYSVIAESLLVDAPTPPRGGWLGGTLEPAPSDGEQVRLLGIGNLANINALVPDQHLTFGSSGLTVVYGDNGSGKSGYARLIKRVVRARHQEDILPNIFARAGGPPEAAVTYSVGNQELEERWAGQASGPLAQVAFYDERCGDNYVSVEAEVSYRPSPLRLLDSLVEAADGVRHGLDELIRLNTNAAQVLPAASEDTPSGQFLRGLSSTTSDAELAEACSLPDNAELELERLASEEARLRSSDPNVESTRGLRLAAALEAAAAELDRLALALGDQAEATLRALKAKAAEKRAAANIASTASFEDVPLSGVGSTSWRGLWEAARRFALEAAGPAQPFPPPVGAHCSLCQQLLDHDAADRMQRFQSFMVDDTQSQASTAEKSWTQALAAVEATQVMTPNLAVNLETLSGGATPLEEEVRSALSAYEQRRAALASLATSADAGPLPASPTALSTKLQTRAGSVRSDAEALDGTAVAIMITSVESERKALQARQALAAGKETLVAELRRRRLRAKLDEVRRQTDTTGITRKATELTRIYVTSSVQDRFSRESDRLGVERVTLQDSGGHKGALRHRPAFLAAEVRAELPRVLSEGEQTALGLAGFFTEAHFDDTASALVLDDPVTSLDHLRRSKVAARLVELARDRQVIVFTHDVVFAAELRKASQRVDVPFTERSVERQRKDGAPGVCAEQHPWSAKDVPARLGHLLAELARIRRDESGWDRATYETETGVWAGRLSETWERIVSMEIANFIMNRGTLEVHMKGVKMLARISEADNQELQESYGRCSQWATRHDKDGALNYTAPSLAELEAEHALVKAWYERVKKYKN